MPPFLSSLMESMVDKNVIVGSVSQVFTLNDWNTNARLSYLKKLRFPQGTTKRTLTVITSDSGTTAAVVVPGDEIFLENLFRGQSWKCLRCADAGMCSGVSSVALEEPLQLTVKEWIKQSLVEKEDGFSCSRAGREKAEQRVAMQRKKQVYALVVCWNPIDFTAPALEISSLPAGSFGACSLIWFTKWWAPHGPNHC